MAYPAGFLANLKDSADIVAVVSHDVILKKNGKVLTGLCPFHSDSKPSLRVDPVKRTYKCYACGEGGDALDWIQRTQNITFAEAVIALCALKGIDVPVDNTYSVEDKKYWGQLSRALIKAQAIYARGLQKSQIHRDYLAERGIQPSTVQKFGLGVVGQGISRFLTQDGFSSETLFDAGIVGKSENGRIYDALRNRITIPLYSSTGHLIGFAGRKGDSGTGPKYLNTAETQLFKKHRELFALNLAKAAIRKSETAVVVEGYFDVISLHQTGEERAVATMGTALTPDHLQVIFSHAKFLVLCYDGDKAGVLAAKRACPQLTEAIRDGNNISFVFLPDQLDPDEFIRQRGHDAWQSQLSQAIPLSEFLLQYITSGRQLHTVEEIAAASLRANSVISRINRNSAPVYFQAFKSAAEKALGVALLNKESA